VVGELTARLGCRAEEEKERRRRRRRRRERWDFQNKFET
jgi:hypothetical protein